MKEIVFQKPPLHIFICTNESHKIPSMPTCAPKITKENFKEIKKWLIEQNLTQKVHATRTHCLGQCSKEGSVMLIYPKGKYITGITTSQEIKEIILKELKLNS